MLSVQTGPGSVHICPHLYQCQSDCLAAGRWRGIVFCLLKVLCGFEDIGVSWTRYHLLTVAVNGGADLWGAVPGLLGSGVHGSRGQRQVHHVQHAAQALGHLSRNTDSWHTLDPQCWFNVFFLLLFYLSDLMQNRLGYEIHCCQEINVNKEEMWSFWLLLYFI